MYKLIARFFQNIESKKLKSIMGLYENDDAIKYDWENK